MSHRYRVKWVGPGDTFGEFATNEKGVAIARAYREHENGNSVVSAVDTQTNKELEL